MPLLEGRSMIMVMNPVRRDAQGLLRTRDATSSVSRPRRPRVLSRAAAPASPAPAAAAAALQAERLPPAPAAPRPAPRRFGRAEAGRTERCAARDRAATRSTECGAS